MWKRMRQYKQKYKWEPRETSMLEPVLRSNWNRGTRHASLVLPTYKFWTQIIYSNAQEDLDWLLACACHPNGIWLGLPKDVTYDVIVQHADQALDMLISRSKHRIEIGQPSPLDKIFVDSCMEVLA